MVGVCANNESLIGHRRTQLPGHLFFSVRYGSGRAGIRHLETNEDLDRLIKHLVSQEDTRCIVMAAAVCDFEPAELIDESGETHELSGYALVLRFLARSGLDGPEWLGAE